MKQVFGRFMGYALIAASITGLLLSIAGLVIVSRVAPGLLDSSLRTVDLLDRTLEATAEGLTVANSSLITANEAVLSLQTTTEGAADTIGSTIPLIHSIGDLVGDDLPATVRATQESLVAVQASATVIDGTLRVLSALPFGVGYSPSKPLQLSIAEVSKSMDGLPASLTEAQAGLNTTASNLEQIEGDLAGMAGSISAIEADLEEAQEVIGRYQGVVGELQVGLTNVRAGLRGWLRYLTLGVSLILIWLGVAQFGLLTQGLEIVSRNRESPERVTGETS